MNTSSCAYVTLDDAYQEVQHKPDHVYKVIIYLLY